MKLHPSLVIVAMLISGNSVAHGQSLPPYMAPIAGKTAATPLGYRDQGYVGAQLPACSNSMAMPRRSSRRTS